MDIEVAGRLVAVRGGPTRILAEFLARSTEAGIPGEVREKAKLYILDSLANMIGGGGHVSSRIIRDLFLGMGGAGEATVLSCGRKLPAPLAAYVNAFQANSLDFDDTFGWFGHPGATAVPPAFAVGEKLGAPGREVLTAVVLAYEVSLRIGMGIQPSPARAEQVMGLATWQIFGAVAAAARLLKLGTEEVEHAFGLAGASAPVAAVRKQGHLPGERPFSWIKNNYGWAAMGGVLAAFLAAAGFVGNRFFLDGEQGFWVMAGSDRHDFDRALTGLGKQFLLPQTSFKPYACCRWSHPAITAIAELQERHPLDPGAVAEVRVRTFRDAAVYLAFGAPASIADAQFSLPYLVALQLCGKSPGGGLREEDLTDEAVLGLARRVRTVEDPEANRRLHERHAMTAEVEVWLRDGSCLRHFVDSARGDPEKPLAADEIVAKFRRLVEPVVGLVGSRMAEDVLHLEEVASVRRMVDGWRRGYRRPA